MDVLTRTAPRGESRYGSALSVVKAEREVRPIAEGSVPGMSVAGHVDVNVAQLEILARRRHCHQISGICGAPVRCQTPASNLL